MEDLLKRIDRNKLPAHIAIIMDGNGRWAKERGLPRIEGHRVGVESIRDVVRFCGEVGVEFLTLYAFSTENWSRPKREINFLMNLLGKFLYKELPELQKNNVRLKAIGRIEKLPASVQEALANAIKETAENEGLTLCLALNYGGREEILEGVKKVASAVLKGDSKLEDIDEAAFQKYLWTAEIPDPDLLIRTSGEERVSNFLLWQISYAELWFTDAYWPDFRRKNLAEALVEYQRRERRFGA